VRFGKHPAEPADERRMFHMVLRLRQICLVARELAPAVEDLTEIFGLAVCYRDPAVAKWGLENALMPIGNGFLEVVAPTRPDTAAGRYLDRRQGDGGYMVILQAGDLEPYRKTVAELGIRLIAEPNYGEYVGMQLHPRDTGGAILSIDWNEGGLADPAGPWHPAGPDWLPARRTDRVTAMRAAELQGDDPDMLARRWSTILDRPVTADAEGYPALQLDDAMLRFVPVTDGRGEGLGCLDLAAADPTSVLETARQRGCATSGNVVTVCGTRFRLV
jgi:hypothetical protein